MLSLLSSLPDDIRDVKVRRNVALLDRRTLEDKYFGLMEETLVNCENDINPENDNLLDAFCIYQLLKKHSRLQEDKMRKYVCPCWDFVLGGWVCVSVLIISATEWPLSYSNYPQTARRKVFLPEILKQKK